MRRHHINTIKSVAADNAGVSYRSIWGFHVIDSEELEDGSMRYLVEGSSDESIGGKIRAVVHLLNPDFVQLREDFESVYGKEMRNVRFENGLYYFEAGNDMFPTSFRGFVRGEFTYIDPWTDETNEIKEGHCTHRNVRVSDVF